MEHQLLLMQWPKNDDELAVQLHLLEDANRRLDSDRDYNHVTLLSQRNIKLTID